MAAILARTGCLLFLLATAATSSGRAQMLTTVGDPERGARLFNEKACARCHGAGAHGTTKAPALDRITRRRTPLELAAAIWNHSPGMSAKARELGIARPVLSGTETGDLLAFLYSLGFVDEPGDPKRGLLLLKQKQCLACHVSGDAAPTDAPALNRLARFASPAAMLHAMWGHAADMQDEMRAHQLPRVTFASYDMSHIQAYFRSISGAASQPTALKGDAREGAKLFAVKGCTRCHAIHGHGSRIASDLGSRNLPRTPSAMAGLLWNHGSRMRLLMDRYGMPQPTLTRDELLNVVAYLYFLGFNDPPGDPLKGRALFRTHGCARCHATGPEVRSRTAPDLSQSQALLSSLEAARLMWQHAPKMEARLKELGMKWPQFGRGELADLIAYLSSLQTASTR
jgi:cytochrome c2